MPEVELFAACGLGKSTLAVIILHTVNPFTIEPIATNETWGTYECQRCNRWHSLLWAYSDCSVLLGILLIVAIDPIQKLLDVGRAIPDAAAEPQVR